MMTSDRTGKGLSKTALRIAEQHALDLLGVEHDEPDFPPKSCEWGMEYETEAIEAYESENMVAVRQADFMISDTHPYVGGTMDGLIGSDGGIEVKCPFNSINHLYNLIDGRQFRTEYQWQVQGYLWIYRLKWIDCISYDPRFPEDKQLFVMRVEPDIEMRKRLIERVELVRVEALRIVEMVMNAA